MSARPRPAPGAAPGAGPVAPPLGADEQHQAIADQEGGGHPEQARHRRPGVPAVVGEGRAAPARLAGLLRQAGALVGSALAGALHHRGLQPVRVGAGERRPEDGQEDGDQEARDDERGALLHAAPQVAPHAAALVGSNRAAGSRSAVAIRSGRVASTAPTTSVVITASPIPISAWRPTITPKVAVGNPLASRNSAASALATTTEVHAVTAVAVRNPPRVLGSAAASARNRK